MEPDFSFVKEKVSVILSDPTCKIRMSNTVVFLTQKCLILIISPLLRISQKCGIHFRREITNKNKHCMEQKNGYQILTLSDKAFKSTFKIGHCHQYHCMEGRLKLR